MAAIVERDVVEPDLAAFDRDRLGAGGSAMPIGSSWIATSSSMSLTERCRLRMCMPTSRR